MEKNNDRKSSMTPDGVSCPPVTPIDGAGTYFGYGAGNRPFSPSFSAQQLAPWWPYSSSNNTTPPFVSTAPVPETGSEGNKNKKSSVYTPSGPARGQHYTLREMTALVDQVIKIEPERMKNGWKVVAAAVQKEIGGTYQARSPKALQKKYDEIALLSCDHPDLGPLVKKIHEKEASDITKKNILTSVEGRPGNIHTLLGNDEEEKNGDGIESESDDEENTPLLRRVKNTQRLKAIETNKKEREKKNEALSVLVAQSAAALAVASNSSGQGVNQKVADIQIEQKHLKRKVEQIEGTVSNLNTTVSGLSTNVEGMRQELSSGLRNIEELISRNMRNN